MAYSKQNEAFIGNKNQFFSQSFDKNDVAAIEGYAESQKFAPFLLENQKKLEQEFRHLLAVLQKQKDENNEAFWAYCYYCVTLLEASHKMYAKYDKEAEYQKIRLKIKQKLQNPSQQIQSDPEKDFFDLFNMSEEEILNSLQTSFKEYLDHLRHLSKIRDDVAFFNGIRNYWTFCRLTLISGLALANDMQIMSKLDAILGTHTDVDKIISVLKAPNGVLNYFSVGFFIVRFMADFIMVLKHTIAPTAEEELARDTWQKRFTFELSKRHPDLANYVVWGTVNFLTNFNTISHIPGPTTGIITAAFLVFDVILISYKWGLAEKEYLTKRAQYRDEQDAYENNQDLSFEDKKKHLDMLHNQLFELDVEWGKKEASFTCDQAAAALLCLGFTVSVLFTPAGIIFVSYFACMVASAMYLSSESYSNLHVKELRLDQAEHTGKDVEFALNEYKTAYADFVFTMIKNTFMPSFMIATFAVCWPAAVALTVLYLGYELAKEYSKHKSKNEEGLPALDDLSDDYETSGDEYETSDDEHELSDDDSGCCDVNAAVWQSF